MYRYQDNQLTLFSFKMPIGMELDETNRWIHLADSISWHTFEHLYAAYFKNKKTGNVAIPFRTLLGAYIIKLLVKTTDKEAVALIQENPSMQYFCGYLEYSTKKPIIVP